MGAGVLTTLTENQTSTALSGAALERQAQSHRVDAVGSVQAVAELLREASAFGLDVQSEIRGLARDVSAIRKATAESYACNLAERINLASDTATEPEDLLEASRLSRKVEYMGRKGLLADAADVRIAAVQEACDAETALKRDLLSGIPDRAAAAFEAGDRDGLQALHLERQALMDDLQALGARAEALRNEMSALTPEGLLADAVAKTDTFFASLKTEKTEEASTQAQSLHCDIQKVTAEVAGRIAADVQASFGSALSSGDLQTACGALEFLGRLSDLHAPAPLCREPTVVSASVSGPGESGRPVDETRIEAIGQLRAFVESARSTGMLSNDELVSIARALNTFTRVLAKSHGDNLGERINLLSQGEPTQEDLRAALRLSRTVERMARQGLFSEPSDTVLDARISALEGERSERTTRLEGINARAETLFNEGDRQGLAELAKERTRLTKEADKLAGRITSARGEREAITPEFLFEEAMTRADNLFEFLAADKSVDARNLARGFHGEISQLVTGHAQRCAEGVHHSFESNLQSGNLGDAARDLAILGRMQDVGVTIAITTAPAPAPVQLETVSGAGKSEPGTGGDAAADLGLRIDDRIEEPTSFQRPDEPIGRNSGTPVFIPPPPVERVEDPVGARVAPPVERVEEPVKADEPVAITAAPVAQQAEQPPERREPPSPPAPPPGTPAGQIVDFHARKRPSLFKSISRALMPWTWRARDNRPSPDSRRIGMLTRVHEERVSEYNRTRTGEQILADFNSGLDDVMRDIGERVTRLRRFNLLEAEQQRRFEATITQYVNNQLQAALGAHDRFTLLAQSVPAIAGEIQQTVSAAGGQMPALTAMNRREWGANVQCETPDEDPLSAVLRQMRARAANERETLSGWAARPAGQPILGTV